MPEVPKALFYPYFDGVKGTSVQTVNENNGGDYQAILAQAAAQQATEQWGAQNQESYMLEEKDFGGMWMPTDGRAQFGMTALSPTIRSRAASPPCGGS